MEKNENPSAEECNELVASLYREHFKYLVEMAKRSGCSSDYAEDIVQDVFQTALEKSADLYASENKVGWLILTLRNRIGHNYRAIKYAQRFMEDIQKVHTGKQETDFLKPDDLYAGLISDEDLSLLIRFCMDGIPVKTIADELQINVETCKKRIQRAKARFLKAYKKHIGNI